MFAYTATYLCALCDVVPVCKFGVGAINVKCRCSCILCMYSHIYIYACTYLCALCDVVPVCKFGVGATDVNADRDILYVNS